MKYEDVLLIFVMILQIQKHNNKNVKKTNSDENYELNLA